MSDLYLYLQPNPNTCITYYCLLTYITFYFRLCRFQGSEAFQDAHQNNGKHRCKTKWSISLAQFKEFSDSTIFFCWQLITMKEWLDIIVADTRSNRRLWTEMLQTTETQNAPTHFALQGSVLSVKWQVTWLNLFHHYNEYTQLHITTVKQSIIKVLYTTALTFRLCLWVTHISSTTAHLLCESLSKVHVTKIKSALSFLPFLFECQLFCSVL